VAAEGSPTLQVALSEAAGTEASPPPQRRGGATTCHVIPFVSPFAGSATRGDPLKPGQGPAPPHTHRRIISEARTRRPVS